MRYYFNICLLDIKKKSKYFLKVQFKLIFNDQDCKYLMTDMINNTKFNCYRF